jgi:hypothetical protein
MRLGLTRIPVRALGDVEDDRHAAREGTGLVCSGGGVLQAQRANVHHQAVASVSGPELS